MKLVWMSINGYKKFEQQCKIDLNSKSIAILGQNEVGKTSLLDALEHISSEETFITAGINQELTRGNIYSDDHRVIQAGFLLEDDDKKLVREIHNGEKVQWIYVNKYADSDVRHGIQPWPSKDFRPRKRLIRLIKSASSLKSFQEFLYSYPLGEENEDFLQGILEELESHEAHLSDEVINQITELQSNLREFIEGTKPGKLKSLVEYIDEFIQSEESHLPSTEILDALVPRLPDFLRFTEENRTLLPEYNLGDDEPISRALENLFLLADLELVALRDAIELNEQGAIETLIQKANSNLSNIFEGAWSQSGVKVHFRVNGSILHIQIEDTNKTYTSIAERSDGLRHFVALIAFVSRRQKADIKPILLIDEVENHLHFDAQADLIQMFAKQEVASKVIYTSHSIGCLPEDLGTGVRIIEPEKNNLERSQINNWFWESNKPGFFPILYGMGAQTLAFIPVRRSLFAEGPADFILLPSMLREIIDKSYLGFQIVPGLSTTSQENIPLLENSAARVAYLVDADSGGDAIVKKLRRAKVPDNRIFRLPKIKEKETTLEDFIDANVYVRSINEYLSRRYDPDKVITKTDLPDTGRPAFVKEWCKSNKLEPPSRRLIAYKVLDENNQSHIVQKIRRQSLRKLFDNIASVL